LQTENVTTRTCTSYTVQYTYQVPGTAPCTVLYVPYLYRYSMSSVTFTVTTIKHRGQTYLRGFPFAVDYPPKCESRFFTPCLLLFFLCVCGIRLILKVSWINPQTHHHRQERRYSIYSMVNIASDRKGVSVERDPTNGIYTVLLDRGENRFNPTLIQDLSDAIATVEAADHPKALIITGQGKFFSNGLDVDWMAKNPKETPSMIEGVWRLLGRILVMDCRTVAAINGHAFGGGLFMALACDYRVMRTKRGFVNFPEVNLGMRLAKVSCRFVMILLPFCSFF
jgi:hypothetical protein